jgi:Flp pilus assembly protein TadG
LGRRGVAALEFALVAPLLLLMLLGMVCLGLYFVYLHELQELASSAARASVAGLSATERNTLAQQYIASALANSPLLLAADLTVTTSTSGSPATLYAVTLTYTLKDSPIPPLAALINLNDAQISRTSTIEFGDY